MFHIAIAALTGGEDAVKLTSEVALVKSALLYADKVTLCSGGTQMILVFGQMRHANKNELMKLVEYIVNEAHVSIPNVEKIRAGLQFYKDITRKKHLSQRELLLRAQMESRLTTSVAEVRANCATMFHSTGIQELILARDSGFLNLHTFSGDWDSEVVLNQYVGFMLDAVTNGNSLPLFDDLSGGAFVGALQQRGIGVSQLDRERSISPALTLDGFQRLPLFESASVSEILDIRRELDPFVKPFRGAMIEFSRDIQSAPWEKDFSKEAELVFQSRVEPQIHAIEEECKSSSALRSFFQKPAAAFASVGGGLGFGAAIAPLMDLSPLLAMSTGAALGAGIQYLENRSRADAKKNQLYLYYGLKRQLE